MGLLLFLFCCFQFFWKGSDSDISHQSAEGFELRQRPKLLTLPNSPSRPPSVLQLHRFLVQGEALLPRASL